MQSDKRSHDTLMSKNLNKTYCKVFSPGKKKWPFQGKRRQGEQQKSINQIGMKMWVDCLGKEKTE